MLVHADTTATRDAGGCPSEQAEVQETVLSRLALRYVKERRAKGELNDRSAAVTRSRLLSFTTTTTVTPQRVTRRHIENWMATAGLSPAYRRARLSTMRGFCGWCVLNGHMRRDPTLGVRAPKQPKYLPRALQRDDAAAVIAAAPDLRAQAISLLMLQEGLRRVEVSRAQLGDVDLRRRELLVRGKGGLGEITRVLPLSEESTTAIMRDLDQHPAKAGPLFRSYTRKHEGLSPGTVGDILREMFKAAGVKQAPGDGRSAHALRHTMAHDMLEAGASLIEIQQALGHATLKTTEVYLRGAVGNLREAMAGRRYTGV